VKVIIYTMLSLSTDNINHSTVFWVIDI